jgi:hypothetical protein
MQSKGFSFPFAKEKLTERCSRYKDGKKPPESLGRARDYNVDIVRKCGVVGR